MAIELPWSSIYPILFLLVFYIVFITVVHYIKERPFSIKNRLLKAEEYIPKDEVHSLYQIGYLILSFTFLLDVSYFIFSPRTIVSPFSVMDIILSLFVIIFLYKKDSKKSLFFVFCLIPISSTVSLAFPNTPVFLFDCLHIIGLVYFAYYFINQFYHYTKHNNLGLTMLLLFSILCVSLFVTTLTERVGLIDAICMISNAFTSNGYAVLGTSYFGKLNGIVLVWEVYLVWCRYSYTLCYYIK